MQNDTDFDPETYGNISQQEIDNAIQKSKIENPQEIHRGIFYTQNKTKCLIYQGQKDDQDVVLKIWNDPRETYEPLDLTAFNKSNQSQILKAPKILDYSMLNIHQGWLLLEKIDTSRKLYSGHPAKDDKQKLTELYIEYRKNFPTQPTHEVPQIEKLPAAEYHITRIDRWEKLARTKNWLEEKYYDLINQAKETIKIKFADTKMTWGQNMLFNDNIFISHPERVATQLPGVEGSLKHEQKQKPNQSEKTNQNTYYLLDFQHVGYKPQGYELAMIVWKSLMEGIERHHTITTQKEFDQEIEEWFEIFKQYNLIDRELFTACLIERACGTILADVGASDRGEGIKKLMLELWSSLLPLSS